MSTWPRPDARWVLPATLAGLVVAGSLALPGLSAAADVDLPPRTAAELLADLQTADVTAFSGTVTHTADLGLPALPALDGGGGPSGSGTDAMSLLSGTHTLRVWASGQRARVAVEGTLGESDVVTDGSQVWLWSSADQTATHVVLPQGLGADAQRDAAERAAAGQVPATPAEVAELVLGALDPTTSVTVGSSSTVAGRPAYELVLQPTDPGSLVASVRIAVDAQEHVPTRVQVFAVGSGTPAIETGFTRLSFATPDDAVFAFTPPQGATVEEKDLTGLADPPGPADGPTVPGGSSAPDVTVVGHGWASVVVADLGGAADLSSLLGTADDGTGADALLAALPRVSGAWGSGSLLTSRLFSVLLTDDGRVLVGAVDGTTLQAAAADPGIG